MLTPSLRRFSLFLTPAAPGYGKLHGTIGMVAERFGGPVFEPHVTVYGGETAEPEEMVALLHRAADGISPFSLRVSGIGATEAYFRSLYLEFCRHPSLMTLHDRFRAGLVTDSGYRLEPHLSLFYGTMADVDKELLRRELMPEEPEMLFDAVKLVMPDPVQGWAGTTDWKTMARINLAR